MASLKEIEDYIDEVMSHYTDSRQPTDDEVRICWLLTEVHRLNKIISYFRENNQHKPDAEERLMDYTTVEIIGLRIAQALEKQTELMEKDHVESQDLMEAINNHIRITKEHMRLHHPEPEVTDALKAH